MAYRSNVFSGRKIPSTPIRGLLRDLREITRDCVGTRQARPVIELRSSDGEETPRDGWSKFDHERKPREAMERLLARVNKQWSRVIVILDGEPFEQCYFRSIFTQHCWSSEGYMHDYIEKDLPADAGY